MSLLQSLEFGGLFYELCVPSVRQRTTGAKSAPGRAEVAFPDDGVQGFPFAVTGGIAEAHPIEPVVVSRGSPGGSATALLGCRSSRRSGGSHRDYVGGRTDVDGPIPYGGQVARSRFEGSGRYQSYCSEGARGTCRADFVVRASTRFDGKLKGVRSI